MKVHRLIHPRSGHVVLISDDIGLMRGLGHNWSEIGRKLGISRSGAKCRLAVGG